MRLAGTLIALVFTGHVAADNCRTVVPIRHVVNQKAAVVQQVLAVPVAPVQVAAYSVGYNAQGDTADALRQIAAELKAIRETLGGQVSSEPTAADTPLAKVEALMATKCAACHKPDVAKAKGGDHALLTAGGKLANDVDLFTLWAAVDEGRMPKGGPALDDDESKLFKELLKEGIRARKAGKS